MLPTNLRKGLLITTIITIASLATGCASVSTLQTGRTLPKGKATTYMGGGTYGGSSYSDDNNLLSVTKILAEAGMRAGVAENVDVGARVTLPGTLYLDGKYQFLNAGEFAVASGLGLGYTNIKTSSSTSESSFTILDFVVPVYASYDFNPSLALYASPKFMARMVSGTNVNSSSSTLVAGTLGVKVGDTWGLMLEGSVLKGLGSNSSFSATQANGVFFWSTEGLSFLN